MRYRGETRKTYARYERYRRDITAHLAKGLSVFAVPPRAHRPLNATVRWIPPPGGGRGHDLRESGRALPGDRAEI